MYIGDNLVSRDDNQSFMFLSSIWVSFIWLILFFHHKRRENIYIHSPIWSLTLPPRPEKVSFLTSNSASLRDVSVTGLQEVHVDQTACLVVVKHGINPKGPAIRLVIFVWSTGLPARSVTSVAPPNQPSSQPANQPTTKQPPPRWCTMIQRKSSQVTWAFAS